MPAQITELDRANFSREVEAFEGVVVVSFWAPWCTPCALFSPLLQELAKEAPETLKIAKVNIDNNNDLAMRFSIREIPTVLLFSRGVVRESLVGAIPKQKLTDALARLRG
jgi:thioredoxin 1